MSKLISKNRIVQMVNPKLSELSETLEDKERGYYIVDITTESEYVFKAKSFSGKLCLLLRWVLEHYILLLGVNASCFERSIGVCYLRSAVLL